MKKMAVVMSCLMCFSATFYGMDKKDKSKSKKLSSKSSDKTLKRSGKKSDIPNLDLTTSSNTPKMRQTGSGTPKPKQPNITSSSGTPKTPVKNFGELQTRVASMKTPTTEDSSTK